MIYWNVFLDLYDLIMWLIDFIIYDLFIIFIFINKLSYFVKKLWNVCIIVVVYIFGILYVWFDVCKL